MDVDEVKALVQEYATKRRLQGEVIPVVHYTLENMPPHAPASMQRLLGHWVVCIGDKPPNIVSVVVNDETGEVKPWSNWFIHLSQRIFWWWYRRHLPTDAD